jgi:hypothetical protein
MCNIFKFTFIFDAYLKVVKRIMYMEVQINN